MKLQRSIVSEISGIQRPGTYWDITSRIKKKLLYSELLLQGKKIIWQASACCRDSILHTWKYCSDPFPSGTDAHSFESGSEKKQLYIKSRPQCSLVMWAT